jgi:hypothetical protein
MQNKVDEINGDSKPKKNIFSKILDAATSSLRKKVEIIQKILSLPVIIGSTIIGSTVIKGIRDILSDEGNEVTNEPIEEKKEKTDDSSIPALSGVLSYNPNVYSEEVLMLQRRLNEIYAGVSGYKKIKEDGYFGPETLAAVNRYKEEYGLWNFGEYEGKVGETTWNHMFSLKIEGRNGQSKLNPISNQENNGQNTTETGGGTEYWRNRIVEEAIYWCQPGNQIIYHSDADHTRLHTLDRNNPPSYIDCSEFTSSVYYTVFNKALNIGTCCGFNKTYPSETQELRGSRVTSIDDLKPGDLMFFDWSDSPCEDGIDHVAIYIGNN